MNFERVWHNAYAPGVPRDLNFEKITMPEALARIARKYPDHNTLYFEGTRKVRQ